MPSAYVLITCELGYEDKTMSKLNKLTGVDATRLDGAYDIIAKINAERYRNFNEDNRIRYEKNGQNSVDGYINCN